MAGSELHSSWQERFAELDSRHEWAVQRLMQDVLDDTELPELDRFVIGRTGSFARLTELHALRGKVDENIGRPILKFHYRDSASISSLGVIAGRTNLRHVLPVDGYGPNRGDAGTPCGVFVDVPVAPLVRGSALEPVEPEGVLTVASVTAPAWQFEGASKENFEFDRPELAIGFRDIFDNRFFRSGVHLMTAKLLEYAPETLVPDTVTVG